MRLELSNALNITSATTWQQLANGWRTGGDLECYACETGGSSYPLTDWANVASRFAQVGAWQPFSGPGGFNDYDSIEVGNGGNDGITPARAPVAAEPVGPGRRPADPRHRPDQPRQGSDTTDPANSGGDLVL